MTMITPSYLGETIEYSSLHACRSTLEDPTSICVCPGDKQNQWEHYREAWYLLHDRAPAPLLKRGRVDLYGIIEDYVSPPRVRRQKSRMRHP